MNLIHLKTFLQIYKVCKTAITHNEIIAITAIKTITTVIVRIPMQISNKIAFYTMPISNFTDRYWKKCMSFFHAVKHVAVRNSFFYFLN